MAEAVQVLVQVLCTSLSPDESMRKAGEEHLKQVIAAPQCDMSVRQAGAIHFKQILIKGWDPKHEGATFRFNEEDKQMVRDNLMEAIVQSPPLIRSQLCETLKAVIYNDFPQQWPGLMPQIGNNLGTAEPPRLYSALYALRILTNKYEFKDEEERQPIQEIVRVTFPHLLNIFQQLIASGSPAAELAELMKLICKTFWSATYLEIPPLLREPEVLTAWMECFEKLMLIPVPTEGQPEDVELRKGWPWWKLKKWVLHVVNRMFSRFGNAKVVKGDHQKAFATMFSKEWAGRFLQSFLQLLDQLRRGVWLPDRVVNLALQYVTTAVGKSSTYKALKPQLDVIMFEIVFPLLCFNQEDAELWRDDPHDYVRKGYDIIEDMYSPRTAAMNLILELASFKGKESLQKFITFLVGIFTRYNETPVEQRSYTQKDGALLAIGSLADRLKQTSPYKDALEDMLIAHVLPEFQSPLGHMRSKAAWVAGQYAEIQFKGNNFQVLLQCIVRGLRDAELPVRVDSVVALRTFVDAMQDLDDIRPILPHLLDELFRLMSEVESEDLVFTLETIVEKFGEEIAPYAVGLTQNLTAAFWKFMAAEEDEDADEDMGALAAMGSLRAIATIMESVSSLPAERLKLLYPELEALCMPIMLKTLSSDDQDVYEEVLEIVSYLTYYSPSISVAMWQLYPIMCKALHDWAMDYFENILIPLDNYISRSTEIFLGSREPHYAAMTLEVVKLALVGNPDATPPRQPPPDEDVLPAPKLLGTILQHCPGQVDEYLEQFVMLAVRRLQMPSCESKNLKCLLVTVVANGLFYNASLCLQKAGKSGKRVLFARSVDKKICALGLMAILALPAEGLPAELQAGLHQVLGGAMTFLTDLKAAEDEEQQRRNAPESSDEEYDEAELENDEEEDDDESVDEDVDVSKLLGQQRAKHLRFGDDDDSDDEWGMDDEEVESALDKVNPYVFFADTMNSVARNPARVEALTAQLDDKQKMTMQGIMAAAEEMRAAAAAVPPGVNGLLGR